METKHPSMLDLLIETHIGLERQGPGSSEAIEQALGFLKPLNKFSRIADLGCGTGGQTIHLAQHLPGTITGLDMFADFIEKLNENGHCWLYGGLAIQKKIFGLNLVRGCD